MLRRLSTSWYVCGPLDFLFVRTLSESFSRFLLEVRVLLSHRCCFKLLRHLKWFKEIPKCTPEDALVGRWYSPRLTGLRKLSNGESWLDHTSRNPLALPSDPLALCSQHQLILSGLMISREPQMVSRTSCFFVHIQQKRESETSPWSMWSPSFLSVFRAPFCGPVTVTRECHALTGFVSMPCRRRW